MTEAERRLRELVGEAALGGEYDAIARITEWARAVGGMARDAENGQRVSQTHVGVEDAFAPGDGSKDRRPDDAMEQTTSPTATRGPADRASQRRRRAPAKGKYPKFFRRGDQLVKIGWSKKERAEYQHKAPRRVIDALAAAITRRAGNGRLFTTDDLTPLKDPTTGEELPGYQTYVALAWFKSAGLVKQHGRRGYTVRKGSHLPEGVETSWGKLPEDVAPGSGR